MTLRNGLDDKLLLLALIVILLAVMIYLNHSGSQQGLVWVQQAIATVVGALSALVTGGAKISSGNNSITEVKQSYQPEDQKK